MWCVRKRTEEMKKACMLLILALLFAVLAGAALGEETVITSKDQLNRPEM